MAPRIGVVVFPGTNCEHDVVQAARGAWAPRASCSGTATPTLGAVDAVVLPGGFAHGDYLRPGALARFSPVMEAVAGFARGRRPGGRHLQRLPGPDRGRAAARRAAEERAAALLVPAGPARVTSTASVLTSGARGRRRAGRSRSTTSRAATSATRPPCAALQDEDRVVLRYARQPERVGRRHRRHRQRGGQRGRADAPPRAGQLARCWAPTDGLVLLRSLWRRPPSRGGLTRRAASRNQTRVTSHLQPGSVGC